MPRYRAPKRSTSRRGPAVSTVTSTGASREALSTTRSPPELTQESVAGTRIVVREQMGGTGTPFEAETVSKQGRPSPDAYAWAGFYIVHVGGVVALSRDQPESVVLQPICDRHDTFLPRPPSG